MTDRPILFSAPMVQAILDGRKTQTRRIGKTQCAEWTELAVEYSLHAKGKVAVATHLAYPNGSARHGICECPYGIPGDRLWVRETFARIDGQTRPWIETDYKATYTHGDRLGDTLGIKKRWTPSIHMPRHASRITLEVTGVRVERLQDISEADAIAEGVRNSLHLPGGRFARENFEHLWWTINGDGSWESNPWMWVIEFKRVEGGAPLITSAVKAAVEVVA